MKARTILTAALTLAALALAGTAAWAATKTVTLSEDNDIPVGTAGHWYVNMLIDNRYDYNLTLSADDLAAGKNVFKVYDDGGKNGNYSRDVQSYLSITIPEGYGFSVTGTICTDATKSYVRFSAVGQYYYITDFLRSDTDGEVKSIKPVISSNSSVLWITFLTYDMTTQYAGLDLTVTIVDLNTDFPISTSTPSHGTIKVDKTRAKLGETVTVTPTPSANYSTTEVSYTVDTTKYVIEPNNGTYSFTMPAGDVTVGAKFLDEVGYLWGEDADGTAENPYVISNKAGWDLLVEKSTYSDDFIHGKYFEMSADISGVTAGLVNFTGHLDGKHHKITFADVAGGIITNGVVNATFSNLSMEGSVNYDYVFKAAPRLTNCFVNVSRTGDGGFTGLSYYGFASTNCAYLVEGIPALFAYGEDVIQPTGTNEVVLNGGATAVRTGTAIGNGDASLYADGFSYNGKEYFKEYATVTLGADLPSGYSLTGYTVTGPTLSEDYTFTMPSHGVTVTAHSARTDYVNHWQASMTIDGSTAAKAYVITTTDGLNLLASEVNGGNPFADTFFRLDDDIAYSYSTAWNDDESSENNFTCIGKHDGWREGSEWYSDNKQFSGHFDGQSHTISGIRIFFMDAISTIDGGYSGLFGSVSGDGTVKDIVLSDARITGYTATGGIVGDNRGTVSGCTVKSDVTIFAIQNGSNYHGSIVGYNKSSSTVSGCTSSACVTVKGDVTDVIGFGGIVGLNYGAIQDCTAAGVVIAAVDGAGAIVGSNRTSATLSGNTYHSSLVGTDAFNIGVGKQYDSSTTYTSGDKTGAMLDDSKLWLFDNRDNTALIAAYAAANKSYTVTLKGRTLWKDGDWSTLCLPFNLDASQVSSLLAPAGLRTLSGSSFQDGTLTLNFSNATTIDAGKPYLIKWDSGDAIVNPVFTGVTVSATSSPVEALYADFIGNYDLFSINSENKGNVLYVGRGNTIGFSKEDRTLNAFGGYFVVKGDALGATTQAIMDFGDGTNTLSLTARQATYAGQTRYWATFYHPNYNYKLPAGAQAFTMDTAHALYCVGDGSIVPAGCAVVIVADAASLTLTMTGSSATPKDGNILQGTSTATAAPAKAYVLSKEGETFGFFKFTGTIPANKAYYVE